MAKRKGKVKSSFTLKTLSDFSVQRLGVCFRFQCSKEKCFKYLFVKEFCSQFWGFPKGQQEGKESWSECASREVKEEIGIFIDPFILERCSRYLISYLSTGVYVIDLVDGFPLVGIQTHLHQHQEILSVEWLSIKQICNKKEDFPISNCTAHFLISLEKEELTWEELYPEKTQQTYYFSEIDSKPIGCFISLPPCSVSSSSSSS